MKNSREYKKGNKVLVADKDQILDGYDVRETRVFVMAAGRKIAITTDWMPAEYLESTWTMINDQLKVDKNLKKNY